MCDITDKPFGTSVPYFCLVHITSAPYFCLLHLILLKKKKYKQNVFQKMLWMVCVCYINCFCWLNHEQGDKILVSMSMCSYFNRRGLCSCREIKLMLVLVCVHTIMDKTSVLFVTRFHCFSCVLFSCKLFTSIVVLVHLCFCCCFVKKKSCHLFSPTLDFTFNQTPSK